MIFHSLFWVFSQFQGTDLDAMKGLGPTYFLTFVLLCFVVPYLLGQFIAKRTRMKDYGWKLALIFVALAFGGEVVGRVAIDDWGRSLGLKPWSESPQRFDLKLGVDLQGGVILIYERDVNAPALGEEADDPTGSGSMTALVEALKRRINPSGTKEIVVRVYGQDQVEIIIPEVDQRAVEHIKNTITTAGVLQFRIVANDRDHSQIIALAREMADDPADQRGRIVRDADGTPVGLWARVAREKGEAGDTGSVRPFKLDVASDELRDASTGDLLEVLPEHQYGGDDAQSRFADYIASLGIKEIDVLMATDDGYDVTGEHLGTVGRGHDEQMQPCILFSMRGEGVDRFSRLTREYSPDGQFVRRLGILLDNELLSAPNIQEMIPGSGRITGRFTKEEVEFMVNILEAGSLPVVLNKNPISENLINPLLGAETIRQGKSAMGLSLAVVLVFIVLYYRFSGVVACMALMANLLFIMALMILIKGAFTLPGLAGLVLTVGMSVDANVLIFERIREELGRGSALRMAIRNGFARATTTIVDANVTTLITAIVLYAIGTDQVRGFAVTLILGILMSMFTAIFCSRIVFDMAERQRWIDKLSMTQILGTTQIDFVGKRWIAGAFSIVVISVGLVGLAARGIDIFDIDFRGGTSVHLMFDKPVETEAVRAPLERQFSGEYDFTLTAMNAAGGITLNNIFKVDSSIPKVEELQEEIQNALAGDTDLRLATYSLDYGDLVQVSFQSPSSEEPSSEGSAEDSTGGEESTNPQDAGGAAATAEPEQSQEAAPSGDAEPQPNEKQSGQPKSDEGAINREVDLPGSQLAFAHELSRVLAQAEVTDETVEGSLPSSAGADESETVADSGDEGVVAEVGTDAELEEPVVGTQIEVELTFGQPINAETLIGEINDAATELKIPISYFQPINPNWDGESSNAFTNWTLRISANQQQVVELLDYLKSKFAETPVWPSSSKIGGQVAGRMQNKAIASLLASLLGIVVYIWIRFQRVIFGLAAVVALVHDVLVTLGAIALSAWLADALGFLLIDSFKISLPIVAALLTIIGYSLNDTIVVFDRIREVRGKSPVLTGDMINASINQTLSRTVLTSMTTLIVVLILYSIGGQGIHGFAFALVVGVIVGTYSSIFVASPVLLWMTGAGKSGRPKPAAA